MKAREPIGPVSDPDDRVTVRFRSDIEGLRAIAILLVVAFHVGVPGFRGGYVGVDVFFVISGYLITSLLVAEVQTTSRLRLLDFYARRVRRLLPASAVTVLATIGVGYLILSPIERQLYARTAFAAALYVSNIWFQRQTADYFAPDVNENPLLHTWSLSVEEQFYFVWPVLILASFAVCKSRRGLAVLVFILTSSSFVAGSWLSAVDHSWTFFASPLRAWEFGVGGAASLAPLYRWRSGTWRKVAVWACLLSIVAAATLFDPSAAFPSAVTVLPVLGTAAALWWGDGQAAAAGVAMPLGARPMQFVGRLSYSWYLWHWPVLLFGAVVLPDLSLPGRLFLGLFSLGPALLSFRLLENPVRHSPLLKRSTALSLLLGGVLTVAAAGAARVANHSAEIAAGAPEQRAIVAASFGSPKALLNSGCFLEYDVERPPDCTFGDVNSSKTLVLFGDSHAAQWFPALEAIANEQGWKLVAFTKSGCPAADISVLLWTVGNRGYPQCSNWRNAALKRIVELRPALVVLASSDNHVTGLRADAQPRLSLQQWRDGTRKTLAALDAARIPGLLLRDTPTLRFNPITCLSRAQAGVLPASGCKADRSAALREDVFRAAKEIAGEFPRVSTLDLSAHVCGPKFCSAMIGDKIVYRDAGHINAGFVRSLTPELRLAVMQRLAPGT